GCHVQSSCSRNSVEFGSTNGRRLQLPQALPSLLGWWHGAMRAIDVPPRGARPAPGGRPAAMALDHALAWQLFDELGAEARRVVGLAHEVVIGNAAELVMGSGRDVRALRPLAPLQRDVAVLLRLAHLHQQLVQPVAAGVLRTKRDEDEPISQLA